MCVSAPGGLAARAEVGRGGGGGGGEGGGGAGGGTYVGEGHDQLTEYNKGCLAQRKEELSSGATKQVWRLFDVASGGFRREAGGYGVVLQSAIKGRVMTLLGCK